MNRRIFGKMSDGREVFSYRLENRRGASCEILNYGAIIRTLNMPDRAGRFQDIVLGFDTPAPYQTSNPYFGAVVGRYGNRIANGRFTLNDREYVLETNNGMHHLHGGTVGYDKRFWEIEAAACEDGVAVQARLESRDGEGGYPGHVTLRVLIQLTDENALRFDYRGTTDRPTILNPTHHSYFNLTGDLERTVLDHTLRIDADLFTPIDDGLIPTGELSPVDGTPFDFRKATTLGSRIDSPSQQLAFAGGYDHNFVLGGYEKGVVREVARVHDDQSGRTMTVSTDQPGMQLYSGNFLDGSLCGKEGVCYPFRSGLCLETQHYPDSPNHAHFPSVVLESGDIYRHETIYQFGID